MVLQSPHFRRHPSEGWGPASAARKRDASLRWHDGTMDDFGITADGGKKPPFTTSIRS